MSDVTRRSFLISAAVLTGASPFGFPAAAAAQVGRPASEDGYDLWLRYRPVLAEPYRSEYRELAGRLLVEGSGASFQAARDELTRALPALLGQQVQLVNEPQAPGTVVLGTPDSSDLIRTVVPKGDLAAVGAEGYVLRSVRQGGALCIVVASTSAVGVLRGAFHLLRLMQTHAHLTSLNVRERPANPIRMVDHWDNLNRTVERGYAGQSIFDWDALPELSPRYTDYARALASLGLNATAVNNVNADSTFLTTGFLPKLAALAGVLRPYGIKLFVSANFASPMDLGGLTTTDPLDDGVKKWWRDKADEIYAAIPDFGGFLIKASSEGQPGPITYGRTHADGANTLAAAVAPHGGIAIYRAFVHGGPDTWTEDAWHEFKPIDGDFAANAVVQIKNGPMDFNPIEPVNPLLGGLPRTNSMLELQITQEYTGHATHLCYLVPEWKQVLDFDTRKNGSGPLVRQIVDGTAYGYSHAGFAGVINFGDDRDWTGHHLAAANTHGFGRLAWNPALPAEDIAAEWIAMTFGPELATGPLRSLLLSSWATYEHYTACLGQAYLVLPLGDHFAPDLPSTVGWHKADGKGIGFDRTTATGSGFAGFYAPPIAAAYEDPATTPEELLLFFHHLPYTHRLASGPTVIQKIYDNHFTAADAAAAERATWHSLETKIDKQRFTEVSERFDDQVDQAYIWRDAVVGYLFKLSRILDESRSWLQIDASKGELLLGGWPNDLPVTVGNASPTDASGHLGLTVPDGWTTGTAAFTVPSTEFAEIKVPVTPPIEPTVAQVTVTVDTPLTVLGTSPRQVTTTPIAGRCVYAVDAGTTTSPVFTGYSRLSPATVWSPDLGYGWVGGAPQSRDRGGPDDLRRDFCCDTTPRVLRLAVPDGKQQLYLLIGDEQVQARGTTVSIGGTQVADSGPLAAGEFTWLHVPLDGGRTVDLTFTGRPGEFWHLVVLALIDPDAPPKAAVVGAPQVNTPLLGGVDNVMTVPVISMTPDHAVQVTLTVSGPDGWSSDPATASIPAAQTVDVKPVVRPPVPPSDGTLQVAATSPDGELGGAHESVDVYAVPAAAKTVFAFDAGPVGSPVLTGYTALTPKSAWDATAGFGWVSGTVLDRDRNRLDVLRRDLVLSQQPCVLRLALPPGSHHAYLMTGDAFAPGARTRVSIGGTVVADSGPAPIPQGTFRWIDWPMSGGDTVDLTLTGSDGDAYWRVVCLVVVSE
jgi:alpha-glucuronidase